IVVSGILTCGGSPARRLRLASRYNAVLVCAGLVCAGLVCPRGLFAAGPQTVLQETRRMAPAATGGDARGAGRFWGRAVAVAGTAAALLTAAPAWADVTVTQTIGGKMMGAGDMAGTSVTRIKGHKMRIDNTRNGTNDTSTIFDVDSGKMIFLNHAKKEAM